MYIQYFFGIVRDQNSNKVTRGNQKKIKSSWKTMSRECAFRLDQW